MATPRRLVRFLLPCCLLLSAGCSLGYRNLHPDEESATYSPLFEDIITFFDAPQWLWTRGTVSGDFDADGGVDEEAVIATIQTGPRRNPDPMTSAFLVICQVNENGSRTAIARTKLFDADPFAGAAGIENNVFQAESVPLRNVRAQVIPDKGKPGDYISVYFWGEGSPKSVWHCGYRLENGLLRKVYDFALLQPIPGMTHANLDRRPEAKKRGFQLIFPASGLPEDIVAKLGKEIEPPLWGHVFVQDDAGLYVQDDLRFGSNYSRVENAWNQAYLKALMSGDFAPGDHAWFEYHLAMLYYFIGKPEMARGFIEKAAGNSTDASLSEAIAKAKERMSD